MNNLNNHHAETEVKNRHAAAAKAPEAALCCPVDHDRRYLEIIPQEVIEKDYGCGDPSRYVKPGETKGMEYKAAIEPSQCCDGGGSC